MPHTRVTPDFDDASVGRRAKAYLRPLRWRADAIGASAILCYHIAAYLEDDEPHCPPYATSRTVAALLETIAGAASHLSETIGFVVGDDTEAMKP